MLTTLVNHLKKMAKFGLKTGLFIGLEVLILKPLAWAAPYGSGPYGSDTYGGSDSPGLLTNTGTQIALASILALVIVAVVVWLWLKSRGKK